MLKYRTEDLKITDIDVEASRFKRFQIFERTHAGLERSLKSVGILSPLLVRETLGKRFELIDGFQRVNYARLAGYSEIKATILPHEAKLLHAILVVLHDRYSAIVSSAVGRAQFLKAAKDMLVSDDEILSSLMPAMELAAHQKVLNNYLEVSDLSPECKAFCLEKNLSLKQCMMLASYSKDVQKLIFGWRNELALTASISMELVTNLSDFCRSSGVLPSELQNWRQVTSIFEEVRDPQQRTARLRDLLKNLRYPLLTKSHGRIQALLSDLNPPDNVKIDWDKSLERQEIVISIKVRNIEDANKAFCWMRQEEMTPLISNILKEL